ncbi:MAG TPA: transposase [Bacteroidia bacterium]|nr:transposase [Bacteroidia bacterium]
MLLELVDWEFHRLKFCSRTMSNYTTSEHYIHHEFNKIIDAKKYACHAGVAPFEHTSGTSLKGKSRVSHLADKEMKTMFHLASLSSISRSGEFKDYFDRRVKEGKNKMLVINAIRNKLIHRIFACVKEKRNYVKKGLQVA